MNHHTAPSEGLKTGEGQNGILLSVITPCSNEGKHLLDMARALSPHLNRISGKGNWQFVFANNGSNDNTQKVISQIQEMWPSSISLNLNRPNYGNALKQGLKHAEGGWAAIINVDFWDSLFLSWAWSHRNNYDLIIGSKRADPYLDERPKYRKILSWGLNVWLQLVFGLVSTDTHGQKLLYMPSMRPVLKDCVMTRGQYDTEFTLRAQRKGLRIAEVPVPIKEERKPRTLMIKKILQNVIDITRLKLTLNKVSATEGIHYHRYSRNDMNSTPRMV
jgi:glycosyltransferase involved in cell wall biosynthesis